MTRFLDPRILARGPSYFLLFYQPLQPAPSSPAPTTSLARHNCFAILASPAAEADTRKRLEYTTANEETGVYTRHEVHAHSSTKSCTPCCPWRSLKNEPAPGAKHNGQLPLSNYVGQFKNCRIGVRFLHPKVLGAGLELVP